MKKEGAKLILDANEAVARISVKTNDICAIYPITPSSPMGEHADALAAKGMTNVWGDVPKVIEMQSEGGAAGTLHGSLQGGAISTTFTASQGLLLMIPNMYKIAGELLPAVIHVASRTVATHALSIFGDHSDTMATRPTGFAMLFGGNVQEAMDMALLAQSATFKSRIPFLNVFDGFRTSHEISKVDEIPDDVIMEMIPENKIYEFKNNALNSENPVIRGTAQNPDVFFQAREACNTFYLNVPGIVRETFEQFEKLTGRSYKLFDYIGAPDAERIVILMGSGSGAVRETVAYLNEKGEKVGAIIVRLYRPFSVEDFISSIPETVKRIAVLDRTKEPGSIGEPLYMDTVNAYVESGRPLPKIIGGRYGLSSKEFHPGMVKAVFDELTKENPKNHFTVGINDDITKLSLEYDPYLTLDKNTINCMFYGLGSDGTVSANKNAIKIIGDTTDNNVQGYFVYDSKKAGGLTVSHLRFGKENIDSTYLITHADFLACHQFVFLSKYDITAKAKPGATFLLNSPYGPDEVWDKLPKHIQDDIVEKELNFYVIDATKVAQEANLGKRINTVLQTCFFAISGVLPKDEAIQKIKDAIVKSYSHKGDEVVQMNFNAVDKSVDNLHKVDYPKQITSNIAMVAPVSEEAPEFVKGVLGEIIAGKGDWLPVSAFPVDGTFPTATTQWEKRGIADKVPVWDAELCTQCNKCVAICPHAAIRAKVYDKSLLDEAPITLKHIAAKGRPFDKDQEVYTLQVAVEDCTGCNLCVEVCPAHSKENEDYKAINMHDKLEVDTVEKVNWEYFIEIPDYDRKELKINTMKGAQFLEPLFEFSGACAGCGETPYVKLISQLYGESMIVANATGCSSIYGGNLPTTPYAVNDEGRGPAWANSLFEDNAEFGLGLRLAANKKKEKATRMLKELEAQVGSELVENILTNPQTTEEEKENQHKYIAELKTKLATIGDDRAEKLNFIADYLKHKSVWIFGGDGWAYDIGYGGLDHVLASGENVNILVMDTEVYSNTGGQMSKATPMGAAAKFAVSGKKQSKKDLALQAITYGDVYVAQIALGAKDAQTLKAIQEAEAYEGVSLIIAYSHCIEHGYDMGDGASHQEKAVDSGYWPLFRFNPENEKGKRFKMDSKPATIPLEDYIYSEARYTRVVRENPELAETLLEGAKADVQARWEKLESVQVL
jgi:pyruvate-ferredoxin/flavodoxin oxidoreductase